MSIMQMLLAARGASGYLMDKSLRFRASASAYLNRTPASAGSRTTWTWSGWLKRGTLSTSQYVFSTDPSNGFYFSGAQADDFTFEVYNGVGADYYVRTSQVFRDPSAWYHFVCVWDSNNATASERQRLYVNGARVTAIITGNAISSGTLSSINNNVVHNIGRYPTTSYFDGYLAEVNFIDGQALTPASFGSTNALTGVWQPAPYTGTYGTNGFYLKFTSNSTAAALGTDFSGNSNTWTVNNISVTAGVTYDSMTDVPTLTNATTANYAVLNPLDKDSALTVLNGNMDVSTTSASVGQVRSSFGMSSGKWYWEFTCGSSGNQDLAGIVKPNATITNYVGSDANGWGYYGNNGQKYNNGSGTAYGSSYTLNDVIGVAFDADAGTLVFYKNNVSQGTAFTGLTSGPYFAAHSDGSAGTSTYAYYNFGQRPFAYTPPTGFVALNTFNLPTSTIVKGNLYFDTTLWVGNGTNQTIANSGAFQPDLVWGKSRTNAYSNVLVDSIRGATNYIVSNATAAEATNAQVYSAFTSTGFSVGNDLTLNANTSNLVAWQWKAGGTSSSNTNGSITSNVSVNAAAGFSVVTYTGTGANATVGHGLGVAPKMVIVKGRTNVADWQMYHVSLGIGATINLNAISARFLSANYWGTSAPTSSVFGVGTLSGNNNSSTTYVAYCFADIDGYSKFGSYTGNGSTDGAFIYTGFRPRFVMVKQTNDVGNWIIWDTARSTYNQMQLYLSPNSSSQELNNAVVSIDSVSNGFKCRTSDNDINGNGDTYIYAAFAENPFKNSLAR